MTENVEAALTLLHSKQYISLEVIEADFAYIFLWLDLLEALGAYLV